MSDLLFLAIGLVVGLLATLVIVGLLIWQKLSELSASHPPRRDDNHHVS